MNISIIGAKGLAKDLAKKGTASDIALYNTSFQGKYFTFVEPEKYPEKIQTLFQSINMSCFSILYITKELPRNVLGECILTLDMLGLKGMVVLNGISIEEIKPILMATSLKDCPIIDNDVSKIMSFLYSLNTEKIEGKTKVVIDHAFLVKSVGTVALGTVLEGEIKKHDVLNIYPRQKSVMIKSIQIHDKDFDKGEFGDRVGLSLKGVDVDEIERGSIISNDIKCFKEVNVNIEKNKYYKEADPSNIMCVVGLQYVNAKLENNKIIFSKEVAYDHEPIIMLTPDKQMRIFGIGKET